MDVGTARRTSSAAPPGRLLGLLGVLAAAAFLLATVSGNSFSQHVGMTASAHGAAVAAGDAAGTSAASEMRQEEPTAPMAVGSDAQHLMHLVGACLAVLAAAAVLLRLLVRRSFRGEGHPIVAALPRVLRPLPDGWWSPPPPVPPRSSPVIRT